MLYRLLCAHTSYSETVTVKDVSCSWQSDEGVAQAPCLFIPSLLLRSALHCCVFGSGVNAEWQGEFMEKRVSVWCLSLRALCVPPCVCLSAGVCCWVRDLEIFVQFMWVLRTLLLRWETYYQTKRSLSFHLSLFPAVSLISQPSVDTLWLFMKPVACLLWDTSQSLWSYSKVQFSLQNFICA